MRNKNIRAMSNEELKEYIGKTEELVGEFVQEYIERNNTKLEENKHIEDYRKRAFHISGIYKYAEWANKKMDINAAVAERIGTIPKRGEIWTCELGQNIGSEENKIRPVIIVQNDTGNEKGPTTIIVPISNRPKKIAVHIELRENDYVLVDGEQDKITGTVLGEQIKIVSKARLGRHIATLEEHFVQLLDAKLKSSLDL